MGCDMVVALERASLNGHTFFGHNSGRPGQERQRLQRTIGRCYSPGEKVSTGALELPQARSTFTVVGGQAAGMWGYYHGINEMSLAVGCSQLRTRLGGGASGLLATDLVRLVLERSASARPATDLLTDLLGRYGQASSGTGTDGAFLIADGREAFALETCGRSWVIQEVREVRAQSDACTIHQDWNRIAPGLASQAIEQHWWPEDGTKLDFAAALMAGPPEQEAPLRRWARASYLLQEQNGHIDSQFMRRLLGDHYDTVDAEPASAVAPLPICQHGDLPSGSKTGLSLIAELDPAVETLSLAWFAFGPPCQSVYFPIFLAGTLPEPFTRGGLDLLAGGLPNDTDRLTGSDLESYSGAREQFCRLQEQFDQQAAEFLQDVLEWKRRGNLAELQRQATLFHQHTLESYERAMEDTLGDHRITRKVAAVW